MSRKPRSTVGRRPAAPAAGTRSASSRRLRARRRDRSRGGHQADTRRRRAMCQMPRTISAPITLPTIPVGWRAECRCGRGEESSPETLRRGSPSPRITVGIQPMASLPGMIARARSPAINPTTRSSRFPRSASVRQGANLWTKSETGRPGRPTRAAATTERPYARSRRQSA